MRHGFRAPAQALQCHTEIVVRFGRAGIDLHSATELSGRFFKPAQ
jgi:hypothetical protein